MNELNNIHTTSISTDVQFSDHAIHDISIDNKPDITYSSYGPSIMKDRKRMILNPDETIVKLITKKIRDNNGMCPYQSSHGLNDDEDIRCPCPSFMSRNKCYCDLFIEEK